jgi:hypothetical protein
MDKFVRNLHILNYGYSYEFDVLLLIVLFAAFLLCVLETLISRHKWRARYFEAGSDVAYRTETFFSQARLENAVALYSRLGGDDVLKITGPGFQS